jgi:hypothetical protein
MTFDDEVIRAICDYMNSDPTEANLTIVQGLTGDRSYTHSELIAFDGEGAVFRAHSPSGDRELRFSWARPITERAEVREQLFAMLDRAMDGFASR